MGIEATLGEDRASDEFAVEWSDVSKVYGEGDDALVAIEGINAQIPYGNFVSVIGPSGCGKSTLLHLTASVLPPSEGAITVNGIDVNSPDYQHHEVGLVFQKPVLLPWRSVKGNVLLPVEIMIENDVLDGTIEDYRDRADELLDLVGLKGFEESYPHELSGGMQQRVSICRSLVYNPSLVAMDEPFGALDAFTRDKLNNELLSIWRETEKTIVFVTHNIEEAIYLSDTVITLSPRPGRIIETIDIDLPRPRDHEVRGSARYNELVARGYSHFEELV